MGPPWTSLNAPTGVVYTGLAIDPANTNRLFAATRSRRFPNHYKRHDVGNYDWHAGGNVRLSPIVRWHQPPAGRVHLWARELILDLDDVPPTVVITTPANGATVAATVTIAATASDNHRVVGVQFQLDGGSLQGEDTRLIPTQFAWNTSLTPTGNHTLTAVARDPTGNTGTSAPVTVNVIRNW